MVASKWGWDVPFMFSNFGWRATLGIIIATALYFVLFKKEFKELEAKSANESGAVEGSKVVSAPVWVIVIHLLFLAWTVFTLHHPALFIGGFNLYCFQNRYRPSPKCDQPQITASWLVSSWLDW